MKNVITFYLFISLTLLVINEIYRLNISFYKSEKLIGSRQPEDNTITFVLVGIIVLLLGFIIGFYLYKTRPGLQQINKMFLDMKTKNMAGANDGFENFLKSERNKISNVLTPTKDLIIDKTSEFYTHSKSESEQDVELNNDNDTTLEVI